MRVRVGGEDRTGRAVEAPGVAAETAAAAIRGESDELTVECPNPGPVHRHVGVVRAGMSFGVRSALAAAARTRGVRAPQDDELESIADRLAELDVSATSLRAERKRIAETTGRETELRERVAALRGRLRALRELNEEASTAEAEFSAVVRRLSEAETERIAAEQAFERAYERRRSTLDRREERMKLRDRKANLARDARRHLVGALADEFAEAVRAVPGEGRVERGAFGFEGDPVTAALAVVRVAELDAPVVLACDRFDSAALAADRLDAPVLQV